MVADSVIAAANACQVATTLISLTAYVPQWVKLCRTKSSADISLRSWCLWIVSSGFAVFYAVVQYLLNGRGWPLIVSTLAGLTFVSVTVWLIVRFRPGTGGHTPRQVPEIRPDGVKRG